MNKQILLLTITSMIFSQNQLIIPPTMSGNNFELTLQESDMEFFKS